MNPFLENIKLKLCPILVALAALVGLSLSATPLTSHHETASRTSHNQSDTPANLSKAMARAMDRNDLTLVKSIIVKGFNINARIADGDTLLIYALQDKDSLIAQYLIEHNANVQLYSADNMHQTALHVAAENDDAATVKLLLAHGAIVDAPDHIGQTPFYWAIELSDFASAEVLLQHKADINSHTDTTVLEGKQVPGDTPLLSAISENKFQTVKFLLDHGADVNNRGLGDASPLLWAMGPCLGIDTNPSSPEAVSYLRIVQMLINKGADVNATTSEGVTSLMIACRDASPALIKLLLASGASVDKTDAKGNKASAYINADNKSAISPLLGTHE